MPSADRRKSHRLSASTPDFDEVVFSKTGASKTMELKDGESLQRWMREATVLDRNSRCIFMPSCSKPMHFSGTCQPCIGLSPEGPCSMLVPVCAFVA